MPNLKLSFRIISSTRNIQSSKLILILITLFFYNHLAIAQCGENGHSTNEKDSWLSCQTSAIPTNLQLPENHWIYYDLGYTYPLGSITIWNYNVENETENGIKDGEIFYSEDGQNWISGGAFEIPEADGQVDYVGWEGIDLNGVAARYITITAYSNWGNSNCTGLSEVRFNIGEQITSVNERVLVSSDLLVFPNPTNQVLSISLNNYKITDLMIINMSGHEILRRSGSQNFNQIDVSQFPSGMYLINVLTSNQELISKRFIKTDL